MIVLDIWGGENSMDHVARFLRSFDDAIEIARAEVKAGFLINMRDEVAWGTFEEFDERSTGRA